MNFRVQKKQKVLDKSVNTPLLDGSTQQQAQLNLIEISNFQFMNEELHSDPHEKMQYDRPPIKTRAKQTNIPLIRHYNRSTELRRSVAQKMTQSFKAGRRASCSQLNTDQVCVIKRKLPLSLSSFVVLGEEKHDQDKIQPSSPITYRPRPCINTRTYYRRREQFNKKDEFNWTQRPKYQVRKLYPYEQSYWRIYKGKN